MFYEPARTQYDWNFSLFGIPIRVSPWFWLLSLFLGMNAGGARELLVWMIAVFTSILAHELGHALADKLFGFPPRIVLYSFGGLTICNRTTPLWWYQNIFISAAGPLAGFGFLGVVYAVFFFLGHHDIWHFIPLLFFPTSVAVPGIAMTNPLLGLLLWDLTFVNVMWGILNLMPIVPLDGGQIMQEFLRWLSPYRGFIWAFGISAFTAGALAVLFLSMRQYFAAAMFGMMAFSNFQLLQFHSRR